MSSDCMNTVCEVSQTEENKNTCRTTNKTQNEKLISKNHMKHIWGKIIVTCTPQIAFGDKMSNYILSQQNNSKKKWIYEILAGTREQDSILHDDRDFLLLPDTHALNTNSVTNWLVIFKNPLLKSIRNLNANHIPMLQKCKHICIRKLTQKTDAVNFKQNQIMFYFHYLPSIFQLHLHICAPYGQYTTNDLYKIHPLENVISNLSIDTDYYKKITLSTVILARGDLSVSVYNDTTEDVKETDEHAN